MFHCSRVTAVALERLQKILAEAGVASRRKCEEIIADGRVTVDGVTVAVMGIKADPDKSIIEVDGRPIRAEGKVYYLLNKPKGVLSTIVDDFGRITVLQFIPGEKRRLFPVGGLDEDTEGLIILTNDGELANILTHPRFGVPKTYSAKLRGAITAEAVEKIKKGFRLEDGRAQAESVYVTHRGKDMSSVRLVMREGRNHIVRRMLAKVGFPAKQLRSDRIAFLTLHGLGKGDSRRLTPDETKRLYAWRNRSAAQKTQKQPQPGADRMPAAPARTGKMGRPQGRQDRRASR